MRKRSYKLFVCILVVVVLGIMLIGSNVRSTVYDLFSPEDELTDIPHESVQVTINGQEMEMLIGKKNDNGDMLSKVRSDRYLPFYRDRNGGLSVHVDRAAGREGMASPSGLMNAIEPVLAFANGSSTKYVSLRVKHGFDAERFLDTAVHDSEDLPAYPSAEKVNTIQTKRFSIGHYTAQTTVAAVLVYYDSRLASLGYTKLRESHGMAMYRSDTRLLIVNAEEESNHVSIITYAVKQN